MSAVMPVLNRRSFLSATLAVAARPVPPRTVVLTFDDAVKSHRSFVGPLLKELGFGATFFVSHGFMTLPDHFLSWAEIGELHRMGFEIGNHSWTHGDFSQPRNAARLAGELALVEGELKRVGVPRPISFAWCGNSFGPEALAVLERAGFRLARRGEVPEGRYGRLDIGARYNPARHHPLLVPTTADAYPNWTLDHFQKVVSHAEAGEAVILQFHGVPDVAHPWVHTPPERFREYMLYLKENGFEVLALRDLERFTAGRYRPDDPLASLRFPPGKPLRLPQEMQATRDNAAYWLPILRRHNYTCEETAQVLGAPAPAESGAAAAGRVLPYPGGRHPRIGFLEGAIGPQRGTKASVFLPWDPAAYVVVDLPEAIFSNLGLIYLAHTHVPTYWDQRNVVIENTDWQPQPDGSLVSAWKLPNSIGFGSRIGAAGDGIDMELWLENGTTEPLSRLRAQVCIMLKGAPEFAQQSNDNKTFTKSEARVRSAAHQLATEWERAGRVWGNPRCPCLHSDPVLPDCAPGQRVSVRVRFDA
jgi:peptidoglycan/xylan/chitin deacetylase (PgdA/CDA1 family)